MKDYPEAVKQAVAAYKPHHESAEETAKREADMQRAATMADADVMRCQGIADDAAIRTLKWAIDNKASNDPMRASLARFISLASPPARPGYFWHQIMVDVAPEVRGRVCDALREAYAMGWIIVAPRAMGDTMVPDSASARDAAPEYKARHMRARLEPWREIIPDIHVTDRGPGPGWTAGDPCWRAETGAPAWCVAPTDARAVMTFSGVLASAYSIVRRFTLCVIKRHRATETMSSSFILTMCRDCDRQLKYEQR